MKDNNIRPRKKNFINYYSKKGSESKFKKRKIKKKFIDKNKSSLFTDVKEEIIETKEKVEIKDDEKEKYLEKKIKMFYEEIQKIKKNDGGNFDYSDFLKTEEIKDYEKISRLINFNENIGNYRRKERNSYIKYNYLSPIQFKIEK